MHAALSKIGPSPRTCLIAIEEFPRYLGTNSQRPERDMALQALTATSQGWCRGWCKYRGLTGALTGGEVGINHGGGARRGPVGGPDPQMPAYCPWYSQTVPGVQQMPPGLCPSLAFRRRPST